MKFRFILIADENKYLYEAYMKNFQTSFLLSFEIPVWLNKKWQEDFIAIWSDNFLLGSVARRRLVESENPSVCSGELESVYRSESVVLSVIKRTCNRSANKSKHPN
jgi:hypothetical protein